MIVKCHAQLLEVIEALGPPRCLSRGLDRWQQEGNQDSDDRNHHQQFHQCKTAKGSLIFYS